MRYYNVSSSALSRNSEWNLLYTCAQTCVCLFLISGAYLAHNMYYIYGGISLTSDIAPQCACAWKFCYRLPENLCTTVSFVAYTHIGCILSFAHQAIVSVNVFEVSFVVLLQVITGHGPQIRVPHGQDNVLLAGSTPRQCRRTVFR
jgi:hypothetical protein